MNTPTAPETNDSVLRRLDKLLAIARHDRSNPAEAAAAAAMAARVMKKYQISEGDVLIAKLNAGTDMETEDVIPTLANWNDVLKRIPLWASRLSVAIARLTETQAVIGSAVTKKGMEKTIRFRGYAPDVKVAAYIMMYLQATIRSLRADFMKTYTFKEQGLTSLRSYTDGLSMGIISAIEEKIEENRLDADMNTSAGTALTVAKDRAVANHFGEARYSKGTKMQVREGYAQGVVDGKSVKINPAIETTPTDGKIAIAFSS